MLYVLPTCRAPVRSKAFFPFKVANLSSLSLIFRQSMVFLLNWEQIIHYRRQLCNYKNIVSWQLSTLKKLLSWQFPNCQRQSTAQTLRRKRTKGAQQNILCCALFVLGLWRRFGASGAVLLLNVANVVMLPFANAASCQLHRPYWKLEIETGNTCTMATLTTPSALPIQNHIISQTTQ